MSRSPALARWAGPVPLDSYPEPRVPGVDWQLQARIVVTTKYLSQYVSVWEDADAVDDLSAMAAELARDLGNLHFRLAEPKESVMAEWIILPAGIVNESVIRIQARRNGQLVDASGDPNKKAKT